MDLVTQVQEFVRRLWAVEVRAQMVDTRIGVLEPVKLRYSERLLHIIGGGRWIGRGWVSNACLLRSCNVLWFLGVGWLFDWQGRGDGSGAGCCVVCYTDSFQILSGSLWTRRSCIHTQMWVVSFVRENPPLICSCRQSSLLHSSWSVADAVIPALTGVYSMLCYVRVPFF